MINESYFQNSAGEKFRYMEKAAAAPKAVILGVHGYAEHIGRYAGHISEFFVQRGFSFFMMENRGHGKSVGRKGHIDRFDQFIDDLHVFRKMVDKRAGGLPVFMLAHSNGSLISARYVLAHGDGIRGLVLSGIPIRTAAKVNPVKLKVGMLLAGVVPKFSMPTELDPYTLCHDKEIVDDYVADPLVHKIMSVGFAKGFLDAMADLLARAGEFRSPVLFQHGGDDRACDPPSAREFYSKIASTDKQFVMYDTLWHEIYNEPGNEGILKTGAEWMEKRI